MSTIAVIRGRQRRLFAEDELPLSVGGAACHVSLQGLGSENPVAFLGHELGDIFIQPAESGSHAVTLTCNGVPLTASRWIVGGDELTIGAVRIRCRAEGDTLLLEITELPRRELSISPPTEATAQPPSVSAIAPVEFTPRWQVPPTRRVVRIRPRSFMLAAILGVLAIGAWYVLTARAVRVEAAPAAATLKVSGGILTPKIGGRYLLRPGMYTVTAELEGYLDLSENFMVGPETPATVRFKLEPLGGVVAIRSRPVEGAAVIVDGSPVGVTPVTGIELGAGEHSVEVRAPLHLPFTTTFQIQPGDPPHEIAADLAPNWAPVTASSSPPGATLSIDRVAAGSTPVSVEVEAGDRLVEIRRPGYKSFSRRVRVTAGEPIDLGVVRLEPEDGLLRVISEPSGATVTVDAEFRGSTPLEVAVAPDVAHEVRVSLAGHATYSNEISVAAAQRIEVRANPEVLTGEVVIASRPPGAEVLIDGASRGTTDQTLHLEARPHQIEIRLGGYIPYRTVLTPEPGLTQAVRADLKQEGPAGMATTVTSPQGAKLVLVGPGRFTMGASRREPGRRANEVLREVEITRPYYMAVHEVSNREYREFASTHMSGAFGGYNLEIDHHPVVNVSWEDAARFCNWLSEKAGLPPVYVVRGGTLTPRSPLPYGYRLPTEAEWAWAARYPDASTARKYAWGDSLPVPAQGGNFGDKSAESILRGSIPDYRDGYPATAPVGSFQANALGLFNLGGNVSEWVQDLYAFAPTATGTVERDPIGPPTGPFHVIRGASWMDVSVTEIRLSYRDHGNTARPDVGFRIVRSAQ
jgi:formylglycine-generating enzyme required for sulfatase activity